MPLDVGQPTSTLSEFLRRVVEWPKSPLDTFFVFFGSLKTGDNKGMNGRVVRTASDAQRQIAWALKNNRDLYICMSTQTVTTTRTSRTGAPFVVGERSAEAAHSHKSMFIDVDVKPDGYPTVQEAEADMVRIGQEIGLPVPSFIINSGNGRHYHWTFTEAVSRERWLPLAHALVNALRQHGFKTKEVGISANGACVLRVPNTLNYKTVPPKPVTEVAVNGDYPIDQLEQILLPRYAGVVAPAVAKRKVTARPAGWGALDPAFATAAVDSFIVAREPPKIEEVAAVCGFTNRVLANGGNGDAEPLWKEAINIACHVQDGDQVAHRLSSGDPRYVPADTDAKYARQKAARLGHPHCRTIQMAGSLECNACPHWKGELAATPFWYLGRGTQPSTTLQPTAFAVAPAAAPVPTTMALPVGYAQDAAGRILRRDDDDKTMKPINNYPVRNGRLVDFGERDEARDVRLLFETTMQGPVEIEVPRTATADLRTFRRTMAAQGVMLNSPNDNHTRNFMTSWIETLHRSQPIEQAVPGFGWYGSGFVFDDTLFVNGITQPVSPHDRVLSDTYRPHGERAKWDAAVALVLARRNAGLNCILASALGGPLVRFTPEDGLWLHAISPPGGNKTTANRVAVAFWGNKNTKLGKIDTTNSVHHKMAVIRNITVFHDDLQILRRQEIETFKFAMQITSGQSRGRLTPDAKARPVGYWSTFYSSNGNGSIHEKMAEYNRENTAALVRVFEITVPPLTASGRLRLGEAAHVLNEVDDNHGHAGRVYAEYLGSNGDTVKRIMKQAIDAVEQAYGCTTDERFWASTMATLLVGASIARHLGLIPFDDQAMVEMRQLLGSSLLAMRASETATDIVITPASAIANIAEYIADCLPSHGARIQKDGRGPFAIAGTNMPTQLKIELNDQTNELWFDLAHARTWLNNRRLAGSAILKELLTLPGVVQHTRALFAGSQTMFLPRVKLVGLKRDAPALAALWN